MVVNRLVMYKLVKRIVSIRAISIQLIIKLVEQRLTVRLVGVRLIFQLDSIQLSLNICQQVRILKILKFKFKK